MKMAMRGRDLAEQGAASCNESTLRTDAEAILTRHFDPDFCAVAPGTIEQMGFQHLKVVDALLAAQAVAHTDFALGASHFLRVLEHQRDDGHLPFLVYGPSVDRSLQWFQSNQTYFPGPAFWERQDEGKSDAQTSATPAVTILAPPIAADVAWQIYRLAPSENAHGGIQFLCDAYPRLKRLDTYLFASRKASVATNTSLLVALHPWETLSPLSPHWKAILALIKGHPEYSGFAKSIPASAKARFQEGMAAFADQEEADAFFEPSMFLASIQAAATNSNGTSTEATFAVSDSEFNALALRSSDALADIASVLLDQLSVCSKLRHSREEMTKDISRLRTQTQRLQHALFASISDGGLWNVKDEILEDSLPRSSSTEISLRGLLPLHSVRLPSDKTSSLLSHFLSSNDTPPFFCHQFPASFFPCQPWSHRPEKTVLLYNYYLHRAFIQTEFPGLAEYLRNKTRDMLCIASVQSTGHPAFALAYDSVTGNPEALVEDGFMGSSLAAALALNILLPAVTPPPSPDIPPLGHSMLTAIMCMELVVAFGVALGCVLFSVYFVVNRPRARPSELARKQSIPGGRGRDDAQHPRTPSHREDLGSYSPQSQRDMEEALLSEDEQYGYGTIAHEQEEEPATGAWKMVTDALASISPW